MKQQMAQLERQLNSEIKRRSEMQKSILTWCDARIAETGEKFRADVAAKRETLQTRVDALRDRALDMKRRFAVDIDAIPVDIENRGRALADRLRASMEEFDRESRSRLGREAAILSKLADDESRARAVPDRSAGRPRNSPKFRRDVREHARLRRCAQKETAS